jgi:hypothetical protein
MLGFYLIMVGILILIGEVFKKHARPYIEQYHYNNKKIKSLCTFFDINYNTKKIFELKKSECLKYVLYYSILILFFYPILFLINQIIIYTIALLDTVKLKTSKSYVR